MTLLFCHGLESGPHGRKYHALVDAGHRVVAPDCRGKDLAARIEILAEAIDKLDAPRVVGSSFGGIAGLLAVQLACEAGARIPGLLLLAPALQVPPPPPLTLAPACPAPTTIIHGTRDDVIPIDLSRAYAQSRGCTLIEVDDDHSLAASLDVMLAALA